eukprot:4305165-Prymnesium_polylepis.1
MTIRQGAEQRTQRGGATVRHSNGRVECRTCHGTCSSGTGTRTWCARHGARRRSFSQDGDAVPAAAAAVLVQPPAVAARIFARRPFGTEK